MNSLKWIPVLVLLVLPWAEAQGTGPRRNMSLNRVNKRLCGCVLDFTRSHGVDQRIYSPALGTYRDLYVYLPPGFDPCQRYPLVFWLHGFAQDEGSFLDYVIEPLDRAIVTGRLPPVIIAAPDGSISGRACYLSAGSFYLNSKAGAYEDYLMHDVWNFLHQHFPIRPEREAHVLAGVSMGGGAAFNKGFKYRDRFKIVVGIFPPLNIRWLDCRGRYMANFDPCCWGWRTDANRHFEVVGRFYGIFTVRLSQIVKPLYGKDPNTMFYVSHDNPIEMLDRLNIQNGELSMFLAYGGRDQFNIDAQVESFLHVARRRGVDIQVAYDPKGKHDVSTAREFIPCILDWLTPQLAPYSPPLYRGR